MTTLAQSARLEARVTPELRALLKRAADLQGSTVTAFLIEAVQSAARRTIEQAEVIKLTAADQDRFARALLAPPPAAPGLKRAVARQSKLLRA